MTPFRILAALLGIDESCMEQGGLPQGPNIRRLRQSVDHDTAKIRRYLDSDLRLIYKDL